MRRKKVWRYYCDFCKKSGCNGGHMERHEASCTANPNRTCRMCRTGKPNIQKMIVALGTGADKTDIDSLRDAANGCPACMLAAIRQSGLQRPPDEEGPGHCLNFHFLKEREAWWKEENANRQSDLLELFRAGEVVARYRAETEAAQSRLERAHQEQRMCHLLSQHEPVASIGIDRDKLRKCIHYIRTGREDTGD